MLKIILPLIALPLLQNSRFNWHSHIIIFPFLCLLTCASFMPSNLIYISPNNLFSLDIMSLTLIILTLWITPLMILASYKITQTSSNSNLFKLTLISLTLVLILCFSTNNLFIFYVMFEASLIPTLALILGWGYQPERLQAGMYLMLYTISASLPLLISLFIILKYTPHMNLMFLSWYTFSPFLSQSTCLWWLMSILAFMVKMPLYLSHLWLPKAHVEAPVAGSMVLAAILLKLGGYGLLRLSMLFPYLSKSLGPLFIAIAMWGAFITGMICLRQPDVKSLIAYSSVGHMGLMIAGAMSVSLWGWWGALLIMIAHGLCSSGLFAIANMTYEQTTTRSMFLTKGLLNLMPAMTLLWFLFLAANMAAPPSLNLAGEIMLLTSILSTSSMTAILLALSSFLAAAYSLFLYTVTQHSPPLSSSNSMNTLISRNLTTLSLHLLPLFLFILNLTFSTFWI